MYMFVYVLYTQAVVEGGEGGGSVQLLTGGRRVSQASPTLSPAILEPSSFVAAVTRQFRWTVEIHGLHRKSCNFCYEFPLVNTDLRLFFREKIPRFYRK